jgi:hypothetical protein
MLSANQDEKKVMSVPTRVIFGFVILLALAVEPAIAGTLFLPRQFESSEMGTVGVAFLNPTLTTASLTFRLRAADGTTLATAQSTLPAKGQRALTLGQIFPDANVAGWFSADTDVDQVTGFWMYGDFSSSTDGAQLLTSNDAIAYPAFATLASASEISFVNLGSATLAGNLNLVNAAGRSVATVPFEVPPVGLFQRTVESLFPTHAGSFDSTGYWISVSSSVSTAKVIGTTLTPRPGTDNIVNNLVFSSFAQGVFPHIVAGGLAGTSYDTILTLTNYRASSTVTLTLTQTSGAVATVQQTIPEYGVLRASVTSLFGLSSVEGWLHVNGGSGSFSGSITYTDTINGGSTSVEMQSSTGGDAGLVFGHIANVSPWWTAIALANASTSDAQVEVYAFDSSGNLIAGPAQSATATFTLAKQTKRGFLVEDLLPQLKTRATDGGYIYVRTTNAVQIFGIELFFLRSGRVYSNVPATRLGRLSLAITPPSSTSTTTSGGTIVVEDSFLGDSSNQPISSVQACAAITLNMHVNNTTGRTVTVTRQYRAIGPSGYSLVMFSVSGDQAAGRTTRFTNVTVPCDAPSGTYSFTGSIDYNGVVSSASNTFPVQSSSGGGGTTGGGSTGGGTSGGNACTPSDSTVCVPATEYQGVPGQDLGGACYDVFRNTSTVSPYMLLAQGGSPLSGYTWTLAPGSTYPAGITVTQTGVVQSSGGRVIKGTHSFVMNVSDGSRTGSGTVTVTTEEVNRNFRGPEDPLTGNLASVCPTVVLQQPSIGTINLPAARAGRDYGASLEIMGIDGTLTWSVSSGSLPPGMVLDQARGVIRGTPFSSAAGQTYRFHILVRSAKSTAATGPEYVISVQ